MGKISMERLIYRRIKSYSNNHYNLLFLNVQKKFRLFMYILIFFITHPINFLYSQKFKAIKNIINGWTRSLIPKKCVE